MARNDFALERRLKALDPDLHQRFCDTVFALQHILSNYQLIFPDFTDHTELHTLSVIDFCNQLIGEQLEKLNADEIYSLLMGAYFHDTGMGVSHKDYEEFSKLIDYGDYFLTHDKDKAPEIIRNFHNEYSGLFIHKYARFFDFPSKEHEFAIIQISRGHRKTDLWDTMQYPPALKVPGSENTICLSYLSALLRLADEIDVTAARNSKALYDLDKVMEEIDLIEFMKHDATRGLDITPEEFVVYVSTEDEKIYQGMIVVVGKMQKTLDYCRSVVHDLTPYRITQERVSLVRI
ncbi:MAG: hypothetical protein J6038_00410 [Bacilli bacterium]|nr:hypothetical protein [Bacilli bacterium]